MPRALAPIPHHIVRRRGSVSSDAEENDHGEGIGSGVFAICLGVCHIHFHRDRTGPGLGAVLGSSGRSRVRG